MIVAYQSPGGHSLRADGPVMDVIVSGPVGAVQTLALVDTGSSISSVAADVLERVGGVPTSTRHVWTIAEEPLLIPAHSGVCISTADGFHMCEGVPLVLATGLQPPVQVLLGRDALGALQFCYDGAGEWHMTRGSVTIAQRGTSPWTAVLIAAVTGVAGGTAWAVIGHLLRRR